MAESQARLSHSLKVLPSVNNLYELSSSESKILLKTLDQLESIKKPHFNLLRSFKKLHSPAVKTFLPTLFDLEFEEMKAKFCQKGQINKIKSLIQGQTEDQRLSQQKLNEKFNHLKSEVEDLKSIIEKSASLIHVLREGLVASMKEKKETEKTISQLVKETENLKVQVVKTCKLNNEKFTALYYKNSLIAEDFRVIKEKIQENDGQERLDSGFPQIFQTFFHEWSKKVLQNIGRVDFFPNPDFSFLDEIKAVNLKKNKKNRVLGKLNELVDKTYDPVIQDFLEGKKQTIRGWKLRNYLDNRFFFLDLPLANVLSDKDLATMLKHWKSPDWERVCKGEHVIHAIGSRLEETWARSEVVGLVQTVFLTPFEVFTFLNAIAGSSPLSAFKVVLTLAYPKRIQYLWVKDGVVNPLVEYLQNRFSFVRKGQGAEFYLGNETFNRLIRNCHRFLKDKQESWRGLEDKV